MLLFFVSMSSDTKTIQFYKNIIIYNREQTKVKSESINNTKSYKTFEQTSSQESITTFRLRRKANTVNTGEDEKKMVADDIHSNINVCSRDERVVHRHIALMIIH